SVVGNGSSRFYSEPLYLGPGDLVRVKSLSQIKETLDSSGKHEHLLFAPAMTQFCGRVLRVRNRVDQIILEGTRRQRKLKDTVVLEEAICDGICHRMCPRQSFLFWRECWLERVEANRTYAYRDRVSLDYFAFGSNFRRSDFAAAFRASIVLAFAPARSS